MNAAHIISVKAPIKTVSESNRRDHWRVKAIRAKSQRSAARLALGPDIKGPPPPYVITLVRIGPKKLDPGNLEASLKHVQDGVADWLAIDDGDPRLTWRYDQRKGAPGEYAAEITIEAAMPAEG